MCHVYQMHPLVHKLKRTRTQFNRRGQLRPSVHQNEVTIELSNRAN